MTVARSRPLEIVTSGDRLAQFQECDRTIRQFFRQGVRAGYAWRDIRNDELWKEGGHDSFEAYVESLRAEYDSVGYKQAMNLIASVTMRDELKDSATEESLEMLKSDRAHRELRNVADVDRSDVLEAAASESRDRGLDSITSGTIQGVLADKEAELTFEEVQKVFAPYGTFKRVDAAWNRKMKGRRFMFEVGPNMNEARSTSVCKTFKTLPEAMAYYAEHLPERYKLTGKGCLTCRNCSATEGSEIYCSSKQQLIPLHQVWTGMSGCQPYLPIAPQEKPDLTLRHAPTREVATGQVEISSSKQHPAGMIGTSGAKGNGTDEHGSPEKYWKPWLDLTGRERYDLDPFTYSTSPIPTAHRFTKEDDGLARSWAVLGEGVGITMWANFPYSLNAECADKFLAELHEGHIQHALVLEKTDNGVGWYKKLLQVCTSFLLIDERVKHVSPEEGKGKSGGFFSSTLFYFGGDPEVFHEAYEDLGFVCQVIPAEMYGR